MQADKAFIEINGEPLWQRQLELLKSLHPQQLFLAGPPRSEWAFADAELLPDAHPGSGPLGGVVAGLRKCTAPLLLVLAVDLPCMSAGCLHRILGLTSSEQGVAPVTDCIEPLAAVYPIAARRLAEEQLAAGEYAMRNLVRRCVHEGLMRELPIPEFERTLFLNVNTPAELRHALLQV